MTTIDRKTLVPIGVVTTIASTLATTSVMLITLMVGFDGRYVSRELHERDMLRVNEELADARRDNEEALNSLRRELLGGLLVLETKLDALKPQPAAPRGSQ